MTPGRVDHGGDDFRRHDGTTEDRDRPPAVDDAADAQVFVSDGRRYAAGRLLLITASQCVSGGGESGGGRGVVQKVSTCG